MIALLCIDDVDLIRRAELPGPCQGCHDNHIPISVARMSAAPDYCCDLLVWTFHVPQLIRQNLDQRAAVAAAARAKALGDCTRMNVVPALREGR